MPKEILTTRQLGGLPIRSSAEPTWINAVIYGTPGVGKTVFAGSASLVEEMSPVLFLDTEQGTMSLTGRYEGIDVVTMRRYDDYATVHNTLKSYRQFPYKTIVIDSITEMAMMGLEEIVERSVKEATLKGREHDPEQPELQDWGRNMTRIHKLIRFFKALPCHVFFIALEAQDTTKTKPKAMPSLNTKRLTLELPGVVDCVWYLYKKENAETKQPYRVMLTDDLPTAMAKDRSGTLPLTITNPTMQIVHDYYTGKLTKESE